jgi:alanine dehydrogenase
MSTPATQPLIEVEWLAPGTHVHTLGPKGAAEGECPKALVRAAEVFMSDSPAQLTAMEGADRPWSEQRPAVSLGEILVGTQPGRTSVDQITLYASVGLAGTEVLLAHQLFNQSPID